MADVAADVDLIELEGRPLDQSATTGGYGGDGGLAYMVTERIERTIRLAELRLRPLGDSLEHRPGQHVLLGAGPEDPSVAPEVCAVANAPRVDGELTVLVSRRPGGWMHQHLWPGQLVQLGGACGGLDLDDPTKAPILALAFGTGLASVLALIDATLTAGGDQEITLLFAARSADEIFCAGTLAYWEQRHPNFRFQPAVIRQASPDGVWGLVPALLADRFEDLAAHRVLIAGEDAFVEVCRTAVLALGARPDRIAVDTVLAAGAAPAGARGMVGASR